ncbi:hypothetical protein CWB85_11205 [Pseudoalteromonas sp. S1727]|uniref:hypothetical protein n=1 Tax=Pseudoalteromonas sp. S1727 TaxID=2066514 RepID=UPI0011099196|nr:hypothetical protein [Pseudoalteromonas sp. S1727]TMN71366.1 hypothetical protein CWB85_11205 [Pseudoalteromonas sp. S1727]
MSNNIKKQSLLGKAPQRKKPTASNNKRKTSAPTRPATEASVKSPEAIEVKKSRTGLICAAIAACIILITPKPQLLTYEKLGLVTQSVYWPGLFGHGTMLFDSHLQPTADLARNSLYLCQNNKQPDTCQKYRIIEQAGFFAAFKKLILD